MKIGKENINKFFPNCIDREKEIINKFLSVANKIMKNSIYGSANYIICNSSLEKKMNDAINK